MLDKKIFDQNYRFLFIYAFLNLSVYFSRHKVKELFFFFFLLEQLRYFYYPIVNSIILNNCVILQD